MSYGNVQFTPEEAHFFYVLTGEQPPLFNTDGGHAAAQVLANYADMIDNQLTPLVQDRINSAQIGMSGEMSKAFVANLEQYTVSPPYILPSTSDLARQLASYTDTASDQAQMAKIQAIVALTVLIVSLAVAVILWIFSPQAAAETVAAAETFARMILNALLRMLEETVLYAIPIGIAIQVGQDTLAQIIALAEHVERTWNWDETLEQIGIGALGGLMGGILKPVEKMLVGSLSKAIMHALESGDHGLDEEAAKLASGLGGGPGGAATGAGLSWKPPTPPVGSAAWWLHNLVHAAVEVPVGIGIGGIHNAGHATLWNLMTGQGLSWNWGTFMGGAAYGVIHPIAQLTGTSIRMGLGVSAPLENVVAAAFGSVTPQHLSAIAAAGDDDPDGGAAGGAQGGGAGGAGSGAADGARGSDEGRAPNDDDYEYEDGESAPLLVARGQSQGSGSGVQGGGQGSARGSGQGGARGGGADESPVVGVLRAVGAPVGPDAAYHIALRTGMVPTVGRAIAHPLYGDPFGPDAAYHIALRTGMVPVAGPVTAHALYGESFKVTMPFYMPRASMPPEVMQEISANPGVPLSQIQVTQTGADAGPLPSAGGAVPPATHDGGVQGPLSSGPSVSAGAQADSASPGGSSLPSDEEGWERAPLLLGPPPLTGPRGGLTVPPNGPLSSPGGTLPPVTSPGGSAAGNRERRSA